MVASGTRNAAAISAALSPEARIALTLRAIRASGLSAG